jgi:hypothetical protein
LRYFGVDHPPPAVLAIMTWLNGTGRKTSIGVLVLLSAALMTTACGGGDDVKLQSQPASTSSGPAPTASASAAAGAGPTISVGSTRNVTADTQPAVNAYVSFMNAMRNAEHSPLARGRKYPSDADFAGWSYSPVRQQYQTYLDLLSRSQTRRAGRPPTLNPRVKSVRLTGARPTVVLTDCETGGDWHSYDTTSNAQVPDVKYTGPQPPFQETITMIKVGNRWGASKIALDESRTCVA